MRSEKFIGPALWATGSSIGPRKHPILSYRPLAHRLCVAVLDQWGVFFGPMRPTRPLRRLPTSSWGVSRRPRTPKRTGVDPRPARGIVLRVTKPDCTVCNGTLRVVLFSWIEDCACVAAAAFHRRMHPTPPPVLPPPLRRLGDEMRRPPRP